MEESTYIRDPKQLAVLIHEIATEFNMAEGSALLMPMKGATTGADL
jgi:hypothetical protein